MKERLKSLIIPVVVVLVLLLPIVISYINNHNLQSVSYEDFEKNVTSGEFSLIYFKDSKNNKLEEIKDKLVSLKNDMEVSINYIEVDSLSDEEKDKLLASGVDLTNGSVYAFIKDGSVAKTFNESEKFDLEVQINKYANNIIPDEEIAYKTITTYKEFAKLYESKKVIMHVFGRNSCYYCNIFKPVYNDMASEHKLDIYYYDSDSFDSTEYNKILTSGIKIPAECTNDGVEKALSDGFGTPLTLFTKKGKVVGCISGYVDASNLKAKLQKVGMIK